MNIFEHIKERLTAFQSDKAVPCDLDSYSWYSAICRCKDVVSEVSREYNDDWITDRVPTKEECNGYRNMFQVTIPQFNGNKTTCMTYEYTTLRGKEVGRWLWYDKISPWAVLAWKPLNEPWTET